MANNSVSHASPGSAKALLDGRFLHGLTNTERPAARPEPGESIEQFVTPAPPQKGDPETMKSPAAEDSPSFDRILLATDFSSASRSAFYTALEVSTLVHGSLLVLHVFENRETDGQPWARTPVAVEAKLPVTELKHEGILCPMEIAVCEGYPARQILNFHERKPHDLIIMGGRHHRDSVRGPGHGVAEAVIAEARCPVLIFGGAIESVPASMESDSQLTLA